MTRIATRADVREMIDEVTTSLLCLGDHRAQPLDLLTEGRDLSVDALDRIAEDRLPLAGIGGGSELDPVARTDRLVLEQLADLRQREAGIVTQPANEPQTIEVLGVVQPVGALGPGSGLEQAELLVVADRPWREAGLGGHLVDLEQAIGHGRD